MDLSDQEIQRDLLHCRRIVYQLSYQGCPHKLIYIYKYTFYKKYIYIDKYTFYKKYIYIGKYTFYKKYIYIDKYIYIMRSTYIYAYKYDGGRRV